MAKLNSGKRPQIVKNVSAFQVVVCFEVTQSGDYSQVIIMKGDSDYFCYGVTEAGDEVRFLLYNKEQLENANVQTIEIDPETLKTEIATNQAPDAISRRAAERESVRQFISQRSRHRGVT